MKVYKSIQCSTSSDAVTNQEFIDMVETTISEVKELLARLRDLHSTCTEDTFDVVEDFGFGDPELANLCYDTVKKVYDSTRNSIAQIL